MEPAQRIGTAMPRAATGTGAAADASANSDDYDDLPDLEDVDDAPLETDGDEYTRSVPSSSSNPSSDSYRAHTRGNPPPVAQGKTNAGLKRGFFGAAARGTNSSESASTSVPAFSNFEQFEHLFTGVSSEGQPQPQPRDTPAQAKSSNAQAHTKQSASSRASEKQPNGASSPSQIKHQQKRAAGNAGMHARGGDSAGDRPSSGAAEESSQASKVCCGAYLLMCTACSIAADGAAGDVLPAASCRDLLARAQGCPSGLWHIKCSTHMHALRAGMRGQFTLCKRFSCLDFTPHMEFERPCPMAGPHNHSPDRRTSTYNMF